MQISVVEVIHYPPELSWDSTESTNPTWQQIEQSIRRLDRDEWPFLWLYTNPPVEGEMPDNGLCIMGGRGEYSVFLSVNDVEIHFHDEARSDETVRVWESDQGSVQKKKDLCDDLSSVLSIAKHFAETAELHPEFSWREW